MVAGDDLHGRRQLDRDVTHEFVKALNSLPVIIARWNAARLLNVGWVVRLGRLVEHEEVRNWSTLVDKVSVQCKVRDQMVANPVFGAPDS